ncbi:uncharacterized protein N7511_007684 [Penicillium nucicola]|uniref:uncharacterized protein n=1 Tax=Penicillium nucicola TaxID=1850975 RepID=UPI002544E6C4|nr:uncharacterized protein N7511_007684 [Penicillium nucicola]KAJ5753531.1 hypothetical protein N7511_007684 [Penicillium nucicola]
MFIFYHAGHEGPFQGDLSFISHDKRVKWDAVKMCMDSDESMDCFAILDCCHVATRYPSSKGLFRVMTSSGNHETASPRGQKTSVTQRLFRAMQRFKPQDSFTTAQWFQQVHLEQPKNAPSAVFQTLNGIGTIKLVFDRKQDTPFRLPRPIYGLTRKDVLVKLTIEGQRDVVNCFSTATHSLPAHTRLEIQDAFETYASVLFLLHMSWEA